MHLTRVQIDEFWAFILKKREYYTTGITR